MEPYASSRGDACSGALMAVRVRVPADSAWVRHIIDDHVHAAGGEVEWEGAPTTESRAITEHLLAGSIGAGGYVLARIHGLAGDKVDAVLLKAWAVLRKRLPNLGEPEIDDDRREPGGYR